MARTGHVVQCDLMTTLGCHLPSFSACQSRKFGFGQPAFDLDLDLVNLGSHPSIRLHPTHTASQLSPLNIYHKVSASQLASYPDRLRTNTPYIVSPHAWQIVTGPMCPSRSCSTNTLPSSLFSPPWPPICSTAFYFSLGVQRPHSHLPPILSSFVPSLPSAACPDGGSSPADAFSHSTD